MQVLRGDDQYMVKFENNLLKNLQIERLVYEENIYLHGQDRVLVPSPNICVASQPNINLIVAIKNQNIFSS